MLILVRGSPNINLPNIDPIVRRINSFKSLPHGWHYGEGRGADQLAVESALHAYRAFREFGITRINETRALTLDDIARQHPPPRTADLSSDLLLH